MPDFQERPSSLLHCGWYMKCVKNVHVPVIGIGGIYTVEDIVEFIMAGASAVQIGTANFSEPLICKNLIENLEKYLQQEGIKDIEEIRRCYLMPFFCRNIISVEIKTKFTGKRT